MSETLSESDAVPNPPESHSEGQKMFFEILSSGEMICRTTKETKQVMSTLSPLNKAEVSTPESEEDVTEPMYLGLSDSEYGDPEDNVSDASLSQSDSESTPPSSPLHDTKEGASPKQSTVTVENSDSDSEPEKIVSRNGQVNWYPHPSQAPAFRPAKPTIKIPTPGPTKLALQCAKDIKSLFKLFLPPTIMNIIVAMTNLEGKRVFLDEWKDIDETTLDAYIGLLLLAGVYKSRGEATASLWKPETGRSIFLATMPLQQFHLLSRTLSFEKHETRPSKAKNRGQEGEDKLAPIREVWDRWVERLPLMYNVGYNVTVDERLIPYRGRCPFRQYMPSKPAKYGIKLWTACDAKTTYAYNMQVYTGKCGELSEKGQGQRVVLDMVEGLKGHMVTIDNFFTSYGLAEELLKRNLTMLGTVRKNKPELPQQLLDTKNRKVHSSTFLFNKKATLVSYCPKKNKNVLLMSTAHKDGELSTRDDCKPMMIMDYNATKGGVDNLDRCTGLYSCQRRTARWPMVLFSNMLDVSAYNAYVIWTEWTAGIKMQQRRFFLEELGRDLVTPFVQRRKIYPQSPAAKAACERMKGVEESSPQTSPNKRTREPEPASHKQTKRVRCQEVGAGRHDLKTRITCAHCSKYICQQHTYTFCKSCAGL